MKKSALIVASLAALLISPAALFADQGPEQFVWTLPASGSAVPEGFAPMVKTSRGYGASFRSTLLDAQGDVIEHGWQRLPQQVSSVRALSIPLDVGTYTLELQHLSPWDEGEVENEITVEFEVVSEWPEQSQSGTAEFQWNKDYRDADYYDENLTGNDIIGYVTTVEIEATELVPAYYHVFIETLDSRFPDGREDVLLPSDDLIQAEYWVGETTSVAVVAVHYDVEDMELTERDKLGGEQEDSLNSKQDRLDNEQGCGCSSSEGSGPAPSAMIVLLMAASFFARVRSQDSVQSCG